MSSKTTIQNLINSNLASSSDITASELRQVLNAMIDDNYLLYEVKELDCTNQFVTDNFDVTGLGINQMAGYAICNGNNGTKDRTGRTAIGTGGAYTLGSTGGSADAVVVSHSHNTLPTGQVNGENASTRPYARWGNSGSDALSQNVTLGTTTVGESGIGKNMQPYLVTLFIQRIA